MLILYAVIACVYGALVHLLICHCSMSLHAHAPAACACALLLQEKIEPPVYVSDRRLVKAVALMQVCADVVLGEGERGCGVMVLLLLVL